jgi:hypothetical protein
LYNSAGEEQTRRARAWPLGLLALSLAVVTRTAALAALVLFVVGCGGGAKSGGGGHAQFGDILDAGSLVGLFQANGLPVGKYQVYKASTDPNRLLGRPGLYTSKSNFIDTRIDQSGFAGEKTIDTEQGGSVEVFASEGDARQRADYVRSITRGSALFAEYSYLRDRVFLRLSKRLTPKQAKAYERLMRSLPARPSGY